jgi:hypothetical protein
VGAVYEDGSISYSDNADIFTENDVQEGYDPTILIAPINNFGDNRWIGVISLILRSKKNNELKSGAKGRI